MKTNWQDMDSAPKDGSRILIKDEDGVYVVAWLDDSVGRYSRKLMCWCIPESEQDEQGGHYVIYNPLGWMPIPE